ncbi:hypothetical protein PybrP1_006097 [[Pythium] brassicae (nom. inval.)]|nr:hypothetical protein PybrP1_006097 [[Pythium] brassicae (nom. inval.)]
MAAAPSGELEKAAQLLRAKQAELYIQAVRDALQCEQQRKLKLLKVTTHLEGKRLEKKFAKERARERERLRQIQEDHALLWRAKVAEWAASGVSDASAAADGSAQLHAPHGGADLNGDDSQKSLPRKASKAALSRLATPRVTASRGSGRGKDHAGSSSAGGETSQEFLTDVIRKQDRERLHRVESLPALTAENLRAMSETDLLHKKAALLQQLHGVVSQQERLVLDEQGTGQTKEAVEPNSI